MARSTLSYWPTYTLLGVFLLMGFSLAGYTYLEEQEEVLAPAGGFVVSSSSQMVTTASSSSSTDTTVVLYPNTRPMMIGTVAVEASVAESWPDRIKGLSGTPYLPPNIVKLFVFDSAGLHSIWMKDMNYAIDIIWVNEAGQIVHIVEGATPESYPAMFVPNTEAKYVIETVEGFVAEHEIALGGTVLLPNL